MTDERIDELRAWANNRLRCCEAALTGRNGEISYLEAARYEQEQRTLCAVLRILNTDTP